jgi:hypothetical protein
MAPRPPSFPAPVTYVTQARPDGSYVANVLVSVAATGHGATEAAAMRAAAAGVAAVVKEELRAARGRPQRLAPQGSR